MKSAVALVVLLAVLASAQAGRKRGAHPPPPDCQAAYMPPPPPPACMESSPPPPPPCEVSSPPPPPPCEVYSPPPPPPCEVYSPPPPPPCEVYSPPPPPPAVVTGDCCASTYGPGGVRDKCYSCIQTGAGTPAQCCSCAATSPLGLTDPVNCIDCVVTAAPADKDSCSLCNSYYPADGNGLIRCYECVKLAGDRMSVFWTPQRELCLTFCSPHKCVPALPDPSQCLDCVKDNESKWFYVTSNNPNGQCPAPGK